MYHDPFGFMRLWSSMMAAPWTVDNNNCNAFDLSAYREMTTSMVRGQTQALKTMEAALTPTRR